MYGIITWGSAYKNALQPLNVVHRTLVRIILNQDYIEGIYTNDLFKKLMILNIEQLYNKLSTSKIYMIKNQLVPHNKNNNNTIVTWNMNDGNFILFKPNTVMIKIFYIYMGIKLFNELPNNVKIINNNRKFKLEIKKWYARIFH
jgi:hypothetical protein